MKKLFSAYSSIGIRDYSLQQDATKNNAFYEDRTHDLLLAVYYKADALPLC
jgi:hypothetical protein